VSDAHLPLTSALLQYRNYPTSFYPEGPSPSQHSGSNYAPLQPPLSSGPSDHTLHDHPSRLYQQAEFSDLSARRSARSHSAGSIAHYYDLDALHTHRPAVMPPSLPSVPPIITGHFDPNYEESRATTKRSPFSASSSSQKMFFSQPSLIEPSPKSIGRGYSFASSRSEFHSFETTDASLPPSSAESYPRHSQALYPMTRSEGFTSGEYSEVDHPQVYPSPTVQLDLPAWHSFHAKDGGGGTR
jgi:hypothetical protein